MGKNLHSDMPGGPCESLAPFILFLAIPNGYTTTYITLLRSVEFL